MKENPQRSLNGHELNLDLFHHKQITNEQGPTITKHNTTQHKMSACVSSYLDTREKASAQMAGQGTKRMAMRPSAAG